MAHGGETPQRYQLMPSGEPPAPNELEHPARVAIEVVVLWRGDVLSVTHVSPPGVFYVGDARSVSDVALPVELLSGLPQGAERLCIAVGSGSQVSAVMPAGARGWLTLPDGSSRRLHQTPELAAEQLVPLGLGYRAHSCFGGIEVQVATVAAGRAPARPDSLGFEPRTLASFGLASLLVAGLLTALSLTPPPLGLTEDERASQERLYRLQSYLTASAERVLRQQEQERPAQRRAAAALPRARHEPLAPAPPAAEQKDRAASEPLPEHEAPRGIPRTAAERQSELESARTFGIIGLLAEHVKMLDDPRLTYQRELSGSELAAMEQMFNAETTWDEGPGGLALSGTGRRGGGRAEVLPLEKLHTVSEGEGTLPEGLAGPGNPSGSHRTTTPLQRAADGLHGAAAVASPATVRRTINAQFSRLRACHEQGLRTHPAVPGWALVSFVLQPEGRAEQLHTRSSNLPSEVVSCIEGVFRDLRFPQPSQPLPIEYPVQLTP